MKKTTILMLLLIFIGYFAMGSVNANESNNELTSINAIQLEGVEGTLLQKLETVIDVQNGYAYSGALTSNGRVFMWGDNSKGQLGIGTTTGKSNIPVEITGKFSLDDNDQIIKISIGRYTSAALSSSGKVFFWGDNSSAQYGNNNAYFASNVPFETTSYFNLTNDKIIDIKTAYNHSIALSQNGKVFTFGDNTEGKIGNDTTNAQRTPLDITARITLNQDEYILNTVISEYMSGIITNQNVFYWGSNSYGEFASGFSSYSPQKFPYKITSYFNLNVGETIIDIDYGYMNGYALTSDHRVFSWGANQYGQIGNGSSSQYTYVTSPLDITSYFGSNTVTDINAGGYSVNAITSDGLVYNWGRNDYLQISPIQTVFVPTVQSYNMLDETNESFVTANVGITNSSYLTSKGQVYTVGYNLFGAIGDATYTDTSTPYLVSLLEPKIYDDMIFESNGGSSVNSISQEAGTEVTAPSDPTKEGYTFAGWFADESLTTEYTFTVMPANEITIYAKWLINQYTITFDSDGGSLVSSLTQDYGTDVLVPESPTKEGYTFAGWSQGVPGSMPANDLTITALWTIGEYTITYVDFNGTILQTTTHQYQADISSVTAPTDPTRIGYEFDGWDIELPLVMVGHHLTLTATYAANEYTITFNSNGGSDVASITQDYQSSVVVPSDPTKEGYTFTGWSQDLPSTMPANDLTITAQWTINQYTITFDSNGGSDVTSIIQDYQSSVVAPNDPTKEGYTFTGWSQDVPSTMPANDLTITAQWTINQYTITFNSNGGTPVAAITQDYLSSVVAPNNPIKEGYTFAGWSQVIPQAMPFNGLTLVAEWTVNSYTVTYDVNGSISTETVDFNEPLSTIPTPTKEGWSFVEWQINGIAVDLSTYLQGSSDVTITSIFEDVTTPEVYGVEDGKTYEKNSVLTITFNEGTATLNGANFISGTEINAPGDYTLIVTDSSGNITTSTFTIEGSSSTWLWIIIVLIVITAILYVTDRFLYKGKYLNQLIKKIKQ